MKKARIKGTDIIVEGLELDEYNKKNIYCKYLNGEYAGVCDRIPSDCLVEIENVNWQSFRAEAAKDILCHLLDRYTGDSDNKGFVTQAIGITDELIKQLKE